VRPPDTPVSPVARLVRPVEAGPPAGSPSQAEADGAFNELIAQAEQEPKRTPQDFDLVCCTVVEPTGKMRGCELQDMLPCGGAAAHEEVISARGRDGAPRWPGPPGNVLMDEVGLGGAGNRFASADGALSAYHLSSFASPALRSRNFPGTAVADLPDAEAEDLWRFLQMQSRGGTNGTNGSTNGIAAGMHPYYSEGSYADGGSMHAGPFGSSVAPPTVYNDSGHASPRGSSIGGARGVDTGMNTPTATWADLGVGTPGSGGAHPYVGMGGHPYAGPPWGVSPELLQQHVHHPSMGHPGIASNPLPPVPSSRGAGSSEARPWSRSCGGAGGSPDETSGESLPSAPQPSARGTLGGPGADDFVVTEVPGNSVLRRVDFELCGYFLLERTIISPGELPIFFFSLFGLTQDFEEVFGLLQFGPGSRKGAVPCK